MASTLKGNYSRFLNQSQKYYGHVAIQHNHIPSQALILLEDSLSPLKAPLLMHHIWLFSQICHIRRLDTSSIQVVCLVLSLPQAFPQNDYLE